MNIDGKIIALAATGIATVCTTLGAIAGWNAHAKQQCDNADNRNTCPGTTNVIDSRSTKNHRPSTAHRTVDERLDCTEESGIIEAACRSAYTRIDEAKAPEVDDATRKVLHSEAANDIRYAMERGTRFLLDRNTELDYWSMPLVDRIELCAQYLDAGDVTSLQRARDLCNDLMHAGGRYHNAEGRLQYAAKAPSIILRAVRQTSTTCDDTTR